MVTLMSSDHGVNRQIDDLANALIGGRMPRRAFITRLLALGLTPAVAGSVLALAANGGTALARQSDVSG